MGYYQYLEECSIFIAKEHLDEIYKRLGDANYPTDEEPTISDALMEHGWEPGFNDKGDIVYLGFIGEKASDEDEEVVLKAIAPYVGELSYIGMRGEDGDMWRWYFVGGKCYELHAKIVWDTAEMKPLYGT